MVVRCFVIEVWNVWDAILPNHPCLGGATHRNMNLSTDDVVSFSRRGVKNRGWGESSRVVSFCGAVALEKHGGLSAIAADYFAV